MFLAPHSLQSLASETDSRASVSAFEWLLVLGFPADVAAAKVMPELFSDRTPAIREKR